MVRLVSQQRERRGERRSHKPMNLILASWGLRVSMAVIWTWKEGWISSAVLLRLSGEGRYSFNSALTSKHTNSNQYELTAEQVHDRLWLYDSDSTTPWLYDSMTLTMTDSMAPWLDDSMTLTMTDSMALQAFKCRWVRVSFLVPVNFYSWNFIRSSAVSSHHLMSSADDPSSGDDVRWCSDPILNRKFSRLHESAHKGRHWALLINLHKFPHKSPTF